MDCGVEGVRAACGGGMLNVPVAGGGVVPGVADSAAPGPPYPPDSDQAQFEADKRAVYKHPLFPLLALLFERCELATQSSDAQSSDAFNLDIQAFVQHQERDQKPFLINEPEIDGLMIKAIQVLRIHLLELEKVQELCKDFCNRYITCLKGKMQSENLLRSDYTQGPGGVMSSLENNNNMLSHGNSESGSDSNSPVQYSISPTQQGVVVGGVGECVEQRGAVLAGGGDVQGGGGVQSGPPRLPDTSSLSHSYQQQQQYLQQPPQLAQQQAVQPPPPPQTVTQPPQGFDPHVVHGSTPLGQIGVNVCPLPVDQVMSGQLSPAPTTPGGSADDCDSDFTSRIGSKKQKRGVLPKHATSVMRSWLFQHLVHPYPTEDEKRHIAAQTNLTLLQVNNWFINARRRILQPMLDAGGGQTDGQGGGALNPASKTSRKKPHNSSRRFWPQDIASLQPQLGSGVLSSSDDECSSYSSDGEEGSLVIDGGNGPLSAGDGRNGHTDTQTPPQQAYSNSSAESNEQQ